MSIGRIWPSERRTYTDPDTGATVHQLTGYKGNSHHLYFTNPGWYDGGRRLLFGSDRDNRTNLFGIDLQDGSITQVTDFEPPPGRELGLLSTCVNPVKDEAYFWYDNELRAVDLTCFAWRTLWTAPEGYRPSMTNCTADGRAVCGTVFEDLSDRIRVDYSRGYVGFRETFEAQPHGQLFKVTTDTAQCEIVHESQHWFGHCNTSPLHAHLLTFCHEGPWERVDNRIWACNLNTGEVWKLRPTKEGERVGHEYWLADGEHIGYHGHSGGVHIYGRIRYDGTDAFEAPFPHGSTHFHSNTFDFIVGDDKPRGHVVLWRWAGDKFDGPRKLALHRSSFHVPQAHVHPRVSPDGSQVLYTSDSSGYGNVYLVDVPAFDALPPVA